MKTLQTLITCLLLFISISANAQEKQNDATWEETVEFLSKNISQFDQVLITKETYQGKTSSKTKKLWYSINDGSLIKSNDYVLSSNYELKLEEIIAVELIKDSMKYDYDWIQITTTKNNVKQKPNFNDNVIYSQGLSITFYKKLVKSYNTNSSYEKSQTKFTHISPKWTPEDEFVQRMLKAFKHLAYLANEKRNKSKF